VTQIGSYWGWVPIPSFIPIHSGENRGNLRDQDAGKTSISDSPFARAYVRQGSLGLMFSIIVELVIVTGSVDEV